MSFQQLEYLKVILETEGLRVSRGSDGSYSKVKRCASFCAKRPVDCGYDSPKKRFKCSEFTSVYTEKRCNNDAEAASLLVEAEATFEGERN